MSTGRARHLEDTAGSGWRSGEAAVLTRFQGNCLLSQHGHLQTLGPFYAPGSQGDCGGSGDGRGSDDDRVF